MLRYDRQIKPGLVTLYDIWPGNGAVYSYNPGARMGPMAKNLNSITQLSHFQLILLTYICTYIYVHHKVISKHPPARLPTGARNVGTYCQH